MTQELTPGSPSHFESIRRVNAAGNESWSSREFAKVLGYVNYRHFEAVIEKAKTACVNSGQREEDHFVGADQMVEIGSGARRKLQTVMMSRYACYLVIQNADPAKEIEKVRKTIEELGGTMPENLPAAESIRKIETKRKRIGKSSKDEE